MNRAVLGAALALSGCGPRALWMADETNRITAAMSAEPYSEDLPGAAGIALASVPGAGDDPLPLGQDQLRGDRDRRSPGATRAARKSKQRGKVRSRFGPYR